MSLYTYLWFVSTLIFYQNINSMAEQTNTETTLSDCNKLCKEQVKIQFHLDCKESKSNKSFCNPENRQKDEENCNTFCVFHRTKIFGYLSGKCN